MLINLRNALMTGKKSPLPPGARWVEYLESTGTQWIDTGFSPGSSFEVFADISTEMTISERDLMGNLTSYSRGAFVIGVYNNFVFVYISGSTRLDSASLGTGRKDIAIAYKQDATSRLLTVNGVDYTNTSLVEVIYSPIYLFVEGPHLSYFSSMRLRNFKGWNNGVLVRDFHPIAIGTTGYLLDLVSGEYLPYGNKGTGNFVIGPDIPSPV